MGIAFRLPWTVGTENHTAIIDANGCSVATAHGCCREDTDNIAWLLAAAPDLLAAVTGLLDTTDADDVQEIGGSPLALARKTAHDAIGKAEGHSHI